MDKNEILNKYKLAIIEHSQSTVKEFNRKLGNIFNIKENIFINRYEDKVNNTVGFSIATLILTNNDLEIEYKGLDAQEKILLDKFLENVREETKEKIIIEDTALDYFFIDTSNDKNKRTFEIVYEGKIKLDKTHDLKQTQIA